MADTNNDESIYSEEQIKERYKELLHNPNYEKLETFNIINT